ncbi:hypothetical protein M413DRAFT_447659 [Hebeloma cylindrosporum]|uniref:Uncharacterized protein n=1 Tax=Hebeloma cylindrosporum TaxID=76867 RepID=A0A0C2YCI6_HEBCY|nr:hypothetical protein M413DRAFT_447659 [Hebeloma cylindrosporum h7]
MGTRGLLGFIIRGQRHAAYNHWDSYPDGLGKAIVEFILSLTPEEYATMARLVAEITWVDLDSKPSPELQAHYQSLGFSDTGVSNQTLEDWYCLLRKMQGAAALPAIKSGKLKHMCESEFEGGDWMWAYYIDFENRMLETWDNEEDPLDKVSFEDLVKDGVEAYLARVNKPGEDE